MLAQYFEMAKNIVRPYVDPLVNQMELPLHPMLVHLPIVLTIILPFLALFISIAISRETLTRLSWFFVVFLALINVSTTYVAAEFGERDEKIVESVVTKHVIHEHEEQAELALYANAGMAAFAFLAWMLPASVKLLFAFLAFAPIYLIGVAGHSGAELVYKYNAGQAHVIALKEKVKRSAGKGKVKAAAKDPVTTDPITTEPKTK